MSSAHTINMVDTPQYTNTGTILWGDFVGRKSGTVAKSTGP